MKSAIIIMAKAPVAGTVKTRLVPLLSAEQSADLAGCLLRDTVNRAKALENQLIIAYSPLERRGFFDEFTNYPLILIEQTGDSLGDKMYAAFQFAFEQNLDSIVMIGTDSPTFPTEFIRQAFELLEADADAVLGGSTDGGFYLIGLKVLRKEIFENVEWSSPRTFEQTVRNIKNSGLRLAEIPSWYDIDEPADVERLMEEFQQNPSIQKIAPLTFKWLEQNVGAGLVPARSVRKDAQKD